LGPLECDHLIVGAGSAGLAAADQLLRRESGSVIVVDSLESPQAHFGECRVPLLFPAWPRLNACAVRGYELYEGWSSWLESDPGFRRSGALFVGEMEEKSPSESCENLSSEAIKSRWSSLGQRNVSARFDRRCGSVDGQAVHAALMWRMRNSGGRFYGGSRLSNLEESDSGVHFMTSRREGVAGKVYLFHGAQAPAVLESMGSRSHQGIETVSEFSLSLSGDFPPVISWPEESAILFATETNSVELWMGGPSGELLPGGNLPTPEVDWKRLAAFRSEWNDWIPGLEEAVIRKARARHRRLPDEVPTEIFTSAGGRILMPGSAGEFQELLFPALAENMVEKVLSGDTGGLLEDLEG